MNSCRSYDMNGPTTLYLLHARFTRSTPQNFSSRLPVPAFMIVATAFAVIAVFVRLSWSAKFLVAYIVCHHHRFRSQVSNSPLSYSADIALWIHFNRIAAVSFLHIFSTSGYVQSLSLFSFIFIFLFSRHNLKASFCNLTIYYTFQFPFSIYTIIFISINIHAEFVRVFCFGLFQVFSLCIYRVIFLSELAQPCNCGSSG